MYVHAHHRRLRAQLSRDVESRKGRLLRLWHVYHNDSNAQLQHIFWEPRMNRWRTGVTLKAILTFFLQRFALYRHLALGRMHVLMLAYTCERQRKKYMLSQGRLHVRMSRLIITPKS